MKLPNKFYKGLILGLLLIIAACFLSPIILRSQIETKTNFSAVLTKSSSVDEGKNSNQILMKGLLFLIAALAILKGYKFYTNNHHLSEKVKRYKDVLGHISSLKEKKDPPKFIKRRIKKRKIKKKSRLSKKQTKRIIDSSRFLSGFRAE